MAEFEFESALLAELEERRDSVSYLRVRETLSVPVTAWPYREDDLHYADGIWVAVRRGGGVEALTFDPIAGNRIQAGPEHVGHLVVDRRTKAIHLVRKEAAPVDPIETHAHARKRGWKFREAAVDGLDVSIRYRGAGTYVFPTLQIGFSFGEARFALVRGLETQGVGSSHGPRSLTTRVPPSTMLPLERSGLDRAAAAACAVDHLPPALRALAGAKHAIRDGGTRLAIYNLACRVAESADHARADRLRRAAHRFLLTSTGKSHD